MPKVDWQGRRQSFLFLAIAFLVVVIDQLSKLWVRSNLLPGMSLPEEGFLRLTHVQNTGAVFGILTNQAFLLTIIALVAIFFILLLYYRFFPPSALTTTVLGLILGGAVGNLVDRLRLGYVTDFIDVRLWGDFHWPAFNFADASTTVGTLVLVGSLLYSIIKRG